MGMLDRVFEVIFARYRRDLGDSNIESAWRRTSNKVSAYVAWPVVAVSAALTVMTYSLLGIGSPIEHKRSVQLIAVFAGLAVAVMLDRRFRKYLATPPPLASEESHIEAQFALWFHASAIGSFILTCCVGFLLHRAGFSFR
jgi:hypothetical protein